MGILTAIAGEVTLLESDHGSPWLLAPLEEVPGTLPFSQGKDPAGAPCWPVPAVGICSQEQAAAAGLFSIAVPWQLSPTEDRQVPPAVLVARLGGYSASLKTWASGARLLK